MRNILILIILASVISCTKTKSGPGTITPNINSKDTTTYCWTCVVSGYITVQNKNYNYASQIDTFCGLNASGMAQLISMLSFNNSPLAGDTTQTRSYSCTAK